MLENGLKLDLQSMWRLPKATQHKHAERNRRKQRNTKGLNPVFFCSEMTVIITELAILLILYGWHVEEW